MLGKPQGARHGGVSSAGTWRPGGVATGTWRPGGGVAAGGVAAGTWRPGGVAVGGGVAAGGVVAALAMAYTVASLAGRRP
jgi:hypothetical protein